ncbi:MAG: class I SAM-dependent methyltransferase [Tissierellales bacterium]|nr:class I SAM-dependent methyltransferase [Tissierellales bacterium]
MIKTLKTKIKNILNLYIRWICKSEFKQQSFTRFNERPVEFAFVFKQIAQICPKKILDVGAGTTALPHLMHNCGCIVTAIDNVKDYWPSGMLNRHFHIIDDNIADSRLNDKFDLITCISVLEHIEKSEAAVRNMFQLLNPNGYLILTFPYTEDIYAENVYKLPGSSYGQNLPYICQSYSREELSKWLRDNDGVIIEQEYWKFWDGDYWTVGNQTIPPRKVNSFDKHQTSCILIQKKS